MTLTALEIKNFSCPSNKNQIKKSDGKGLFILVKKNNSKFWRLRYKYACKHQEMALGKYPTVSIHEARKMAEEARMLLVQGVNPMDEKKERKRASNPEDRAFNVIALKWWEQQKDTWSKDHAKRVKRWITEDAKLIGKLAIDQIDTGHITALMLSIKKGGSPTKAAPILSVIKRVFGYGLAHRLTRTNPAQDFPLRDVIGPLPAVKHRAAVVRKSELAKLINDIDHCETGTYCTVEALKLIPRLFLRPGEIRFLKWSYVDFDDQIIRLPGEIMKSGREHMIPMANQVANKLEGIREITGYSPYVFPGQSGGNPISKNVLVNRLRALGYAADVVSAHGFRTTASTLLHEKGWEPDVVEVQLSHLIGTATSRAYNRSLYLKQRKGMMQDWADFLDALSSTSL